MKLVLLAILSLSAPAFADGGNDGGHQHSKDVCSTLNPQVCAHLGIHAPLNSSTEGEFIVHAMTPAGVEIANLNVELWMDMGNGSGHSSAPVELAKLGANRYQVSNAWFVMLGAWTVRVSFELPTANGPQKHQLEFPVEILE